MTLKRGQHLKYLPYAFTEQGVAMLSSVLRSERAVQVNVAIMRAFVSLRRMLAGNEALARKLAELERRLEGYSLSASTGERVRVRCRFGIRPVRRHPRTRRPACQTARGNRLSHQGRQRALPGETKVTMPDEFQYDIFSSHSAKDKAVVRAVAERLRKDRLTPNAKGQRLKSKVELQPSAFILQPSAFVSCVRFGFRRAGIGGRHVPISAETGSGETIALPALAR